MSKPTLLRFFVATLLIGVVVSFAEAQHKGINFQASIKRPDQSLPTATGLSVTAQILDPVNNCVLREEIHSGVSVANGYMNLVIGGSTAFTPVGLNPSPVLSLVEVMDNARLRTGLNCIDVANNIVASNQTYTPSTSHSRKLRIRVNILGDDVIADFNMRSVAFAVNAETLNGKATSDFVNINSGQGLIQTNVESVFNRFTKLDAILNNFNSAGTSLSANITGNAATATTAISATNVTGTVAVANGGTGATTASAARTNLGLGSLAVVTPTGTPDGTKFLRDDNTWQTVAGGVTSVAGRSGAVTLSSTDISGLGSLATMATSGTANSTTFLRGDGAWTAVSTTDATKLPLAGGALTGSLTMNAQNEVRFADSDSSNYVGFRAPLTIGTNRIWTLPSADGSAGQILRTDGSGNLSWVNDSSGGALSDADYSTKGVVQFLTSAATSGISVVSGVASVNTGTGSNQIVKLDSSARLPAIDGSALINLNASNLASGTLPVNRLPALSGDVTTSAGSSVTSVDAIKGKAVVPVAYSTGQVLRYDGTNWVNNYISMFDLRSTVTGAATFGSGSTGCTSGQTLTWTAASDNLACTNISLPVGQLTGTLPLASGGTGATTQAGAANAILPAQTSHSGKVLTTNGTNVSWGTVAGMPDPTGHSGKVLVSDGTNANWMAPNNSCSKTLLNVNYSFGVRTSTITASTTFTIGGGFPSDMVDGTDLQKFYFTNGSTIGGKDITFQLSNPVIITGAAFLHHNSNSFFIASSTYKWQGSNDGTSWTDLSGTITSNGVAPMSPFGANATVSTFNTGKLSFSYYRILGLSGTANQSPYLTEVYFEVCD